VAGGGYGGNSSEIAELIIIGTQNRGIKTFDRGFQLRYGAAYSFA